jgi:peptide deformylase
MSDNNKDTLSNENIVIYPDSRLTEPAVNVTDFKDPLFLSVVEQLTNKMSLFGHCVGLAANQIGSYLNIFVADASKNNRETSKFGFVVVVNGEIVTMSGVEQKREGCMSVPDLTVDITRYESVVITGFDQNGDLVEYRVNGFEARVFQHEIDHLKGKVILDRAKSSRDIFIRKKYRK